MAAQVLTNVLHHIPRITFGLHPATGAFTLQLDSDYVQVRFHSVSSFMCLFLELYYGCSENLLRAAPETQFVAGARRTPSKDPFLLKHTTAN